MNLLRKIIVGATIFGLCLSAIPVIPVTAQASQEVQDKKVKESKSKTGDQIINPMTAISEKEPNNSFSSADYMGVNDYMQASFSPAGDVDYFWFRAEVTGPHTIWSNSTTDPDGVLFDSNQNFLWDDQNYGNFSITYNLTADHVYYIKTFHGSGGTGNYGIIISHP